MRQNSYPGKIIRILLLCLNTDMRRWGLSETTEKVSDTPVPKTCLVQLQILSNPLESTGLVV